VCWLHSVMGKHYMSIAAFAQQALAQYARWKESRFRYNWMTTNKLYFQNTDESCVWLYLFLSTYHVIDWWQCRGLAIAHP
jgi:hypothetical protein